MRGQVFDKLRKSYVPLTPEEEVRQWFIAVLENECSVPISHMLSEWEFNMAGKVYRADIMVWGADARPLALVECKRPDVPLNRTVLEQALCYDVALHLKWLFLTNGNTTRVLKKVNGTYVAYDKLPSYDEMSA